MEATIAATTPATMLVPGSPDGCAGRLITSKARSGQSVPRPLPGFFRRFNDTDPPIAVIARALSSIIMAPYPPTTPIQHTTPTSSAVISSLSGAVSTFRSPNIFTISTILFAAPARVISSPSSRRFTSPSALRTG